jgi:hypothetical protein
MQTDFIEAILVRLDAERKLLWPTDVSYPLYVAGSEGITWTFGLSRP